MKKINNKINCCYDRDNYDNNHNNNHNHNHNNKGFSLIELSIVLIIMGLLVAGITGGAALIKSAQLRTLMTEFQNYRVAFNTYYGLYDRVPGFLDYTGINGVTNSLVAWTDLKDEGIIEKSIEGDGFVPSKYKNAYWFIYHGSDYFNVSDFQNSNLLSLTSIGNPLAGVLGAREAKSLLEKLDDGAPNTGLVRALTCTNEGRSSCATVTSLSTESTNTQLYVLVSKLDF